MVRCVVDVGLSLGSFVLAESHGSFRAIFEVEHAIITSDGIKVALIVDSGSHLLVGW